MDDLNVFRLFVAACEAGSFSAAASTLGLSRSAVAKAVARLEQRTGVRLFQRTTRAMTMTDEGRALYERSARTVAELESTLDELVGRRDEPRGTLRMTLPDAYGRSRVMPVLARFLAQWPRLQADVSFSDRSVDVISEGFDLAIRIGGIATTSEELISRVVARHRVSLCASPAYLACHGEPRALDELRGHAALHFAQRGRPFPWRLRDADGRTVQLDPESRIRFDSGEALCHAAAEGLGIVQLPDFVVEPAIASGRLRRILEASEPDPIPVVALYPSRRHLALKVRLFIDGLTG